MHRLRKSPSTSRRVSCRTFVVLPALVSLKDIVEVVSLAPRGQISERLCQQIVEVSVPQVAEQFCAGMFECSEKEEWLDGSAPAWCSGILCRCAFLSFF